MVLVPSIGDELAFAQLGDERRTKRLQMIAEDWSAAPDKSVLQSAKSGAKAEGAYKFLNNHGFTYAQIVESHVEQTYERIAAEGTVIVAHDTTEVEYQGQAVREGLSRLQGGDQGFLAHVALAIAADGSRRPLGVAAFLPWVRGARARARKANGQKLTARDRAKLDNKESVRWGQTVEEVSLRVRGASVIHVMDREADAFPLLAQLVEGEHRFVVRLCQDRVVRAEGSDGTILSLKQAIRKVEGLFELDVPIGRRAATTIPRRNQRFPPREARVAKLEFAATAIEVRRPSHRTDLPDWLSIHVVHVREIDAPPGCEPVEWLLATTEPTSTREQVIDVVEKYRTRWVIEEYFKALKTGCALEKRQHESYETLLKVMAIFLPIAWRMLLLRSLNRSSPDAPATIALTRTQIEILRSCSPLKLDQTPTARQALEAIALMGGHHKSNGAPGWLTLARGFQHLLALEQGWMAREKKDQK